MHRAYSRADRFGHLLQREIAELVRTEVKDPRVSGITVLDVEVSKDLAHATVFFSMLGEQGHLEAEQALNHAGGFLRHELGRRLSVRTVPQLRFRYDPTEERAMALSKLIDDARARDRHED
jgi:ribosome-binding factor A